MRLAPLRKEIERFEKRIKTELTNWDVQSRTFGCGSDDAAQSFVILRILMCLIGYTERKCQYVYNKWSMRGSIDYDR